MLKDLRSLEDEFKQLEQALATPELINDQSRYRTAMQRYAELTPIVKTSSEYGDVCHRLGQTETSLQDPEVQADAELYALAKEEKAELNDAKERLEKELERLLIPKDPYDDKNVIIEIRAAAGGDEAALFASEVCDMYQRYADTLGYKTEMGDVYRNDIGGYTKVGFEIKGHGAYSIYKFESGVHRVQRVPQTETQGRIHTSTITVAVLPEADDVDVQLVASDYRVDVYRSSGPGGQSVNTTDSAVRIVYKEGTEDEIVVTCQDGKSQIKNKEKALVVLRARILERELAKAQAEAREARLVQIGTGERSEKIRTYNFPQSRITDHRIGFTTRSLEQVMAGDLSDISQALREAEQQERLAELSQKDETALAPA